MWRDGFQEKLGSLSQSKMSPFHKTESFFVVLEGLPGSGWRRPEPVISRLLADYYLIYYIVGEVGNNEQDCGES
jgi:hypothetical protein